MSKKKKSKAIIRPEKIILAHRNPDFDAFSASFGAKILFPDHVVIHSGEPSKNLEEFITIYEERFPFYRDGEVDFSGVREAVICDTSVPGRLGNKAKQFFSENHIQVKIYDHHPVDEDEIFPGQMIDEIILEEIGSASTIITELIKEKNIKLSTEESTLLAIGIYEDTGNFLFSSTTPRDMMSTSFLLEKGANIDVISAFVKMEMTPEQEKIMKVLEKNMIVKEINKAEIAVGEAETEEFIGGLNLITSKLWLSQGYDTFISIVKMGKKTYIVGRTMSPDVNLGELMGALRGGGHKRAAACKLVGVSLKEAENKLLEQLKQYVKPAVMAYEIMSSPVKTMLSGMKIKRAYKIMQITGFGGIPVVEENKLVGMVVRRDVQKAMDHRMGDHPVKAIMSTNLVAVNARESVETVKEKMIQNGVGRIPVISNGILQGIITRTDIIREVYHHDKMKEEISLQGHNLQQFNIKRTMIKGLDFGVYKLLERIGGKGDENGYRLFIVGGFVRDLLLGYENLDIDLVVEGNAINFVKILQESFDITVEIHQKFLTAKVFFNEEEIEIDFATARTEYYDYPGALPSVDEAHLKKDLHRRDFTINAMAVSINERDYGRLVDYFGCRRDLQNGVVRVLYNTSFIDDPTRILRGIRYEKRYDFEIEERTMELLKKGLVDKYLEKISGGRIRYELTRILEEKNRSEIILQLGRLNVLKHLFDKTYYTPLLEKKIKRLFSGMEWFETFYKGNPGLDRFYVLIFLLTEYYTEKQLEEIQDRYGLPKKIVKEIYAFSKRVEIVSQMLNTEMDFSDIYSLIEENSPEAVVYMTSYLTERGLEHLKEYLRARKRVRLYYTTGKKLIRDYRVPQGERIKEIIREVIKKKLDGELDDAESEKRFLEEDINLITP